MTLLDIDIALFTYEERIALIKFQSSKDSKC